ncbi:MAG TPA: hypothetical protein VNM91_03165, partial [Dehalococcoidia bacterium]|nr:hypothetical protein [Dehalococcoidia bacterium]
MSNDPTTTAGDLAAASAAAAAAAPGEDARVPIGGLRPADGAAPPVARSSVRDFGLRALVVLCILNAI